MRSKLKAQSSREQRSPSAFSLQPSAASERLIVALDCLTLSRALAIAKRLRGLARTVKVGSALFTTAGPEAVVRLRRLGFEVMLDLKFFDIPSTVELSCRAAAAHGAALLTVHAGGGQEMLRAAVRGARHGTGRRTQQVPKVLGVTVLTSVAGRRSVTNNVLRLALSARAAGCDGVVASAQEAAMLRRRLGRRLAIVCPGVRPVSVAQDDQQRVSTPQAALKAGADYLVIGRPITDAADPCRAARRILAEMEECAC